MEVLCVKVSLGRQVEGGNSKMEGTVSVSHVSLFPRMPP